MENGEGVDVGVEQAANRRQSKHQITEPVREVDEQRRG